MDPLVSIIIPAFNAEKFISETVNSVLTQSYTNWELIIVNDGSTDSTKNLIENFAQTDKRIQPIHQKNMGVSLTRNNGFKHATGQYIALLDADDVWLENNLLEKINMLQSDSSLGFVFSNRGIINEKSEFIDIVSAGSDINIFENTLSWNGDPVPGPCSNVVFRASCLEQNISFNPALSNIADKHFVLQLAKQFKGKLIPHVLWNYRRVTGSMSKSILLHETDTLRAYEIYKKSGYFKNSLFKRKCYSKMYLIIAASWWYDGNNKLRSLRFLFLAFITAPFFTTRQLFQKFFSSSVEK